MIINFLESLIASYFFTNYFDLKINKYVYFIINFVLISSVINLFDYVKDYSIILPIIVALIASLIALLELKTITGNIIYYIFRSIKCWSFNSFFFNSRKFCKYIC